MWLKRKDFVKLVEKRRLGLPDELTLHLREFEVVLYHIRGALPPGCVSPRWQRRPEQAMAEQLRDFRRREGMNKRCLDT